jgi:hypothetical protein
MSITYSGCVFVVLDSQNAIRVCHIVIFTLVLHEVSTEFNVDDKRSRCELVEGAELRKEF